MSEVFDPYHRWLGIPPKDQPPDLYRLLGIERFESDPEVIRDASEQRMAHVRTYQLGQHTALSQRILNELAAAKGTLLDPEKRAAYDAELRTRAAPPEISAPSAARRRRWAAAAGGAVTCAAVVVALSLRGGQPQPAEQVASAKPESPKAVSLQPAPEEPAPEKPAPQPAALVYVPLFNGESLEGWRFLNPERPHTWKVENSLLSTPYPLFSRLGR